LYSIKTFLTVGTIKVLIGIGSGSGRSSNSLLIIPPITATALPPTYALIGIGDGKF
jgi:hypothetical protein